VLFPDSSEPENKEERRWVITASDRKGYDDGPSTRILISRWNRLQFCSICLSISSDLAFAAWSTVETWPPMVVDGGGGGGGGYGLSGHPITTPGSLHQLGPFKFSGIHLSQGGPKFLGSSKHPPTWNVREAGIYQGSVKFGFIRHVREPSHSKLTGKKGIAVVPREAWGQ